MAFRLLFLFLFSVGSLTAVPTAENPVEVVLVSDTKTIEPGKPFVVAVQMQLLEGWHVYGRNAGEFGSPTEIDLSLPEGFVTKSMPWPAEESFLFADIESSGYHGPVELPVQIIPPTTLMSDSVEIVGTVRWIACGTSCIPGEGTVSLQLAATAGATKAEIGSLWIAIAAAFLGGLILNLMPCVLPVISLKIMSFVQLAGGSRKEALRHGLAFTVGVIGSFWLLAGGMILLQSWGEAVGWGFQLQDPRFVASMAIVLFVLGLSMVGVFEMGLFIAAQAGSATGGKGLIGSLWGGVLATLVATPCTGPFLGPVLGYAATVPPAASIAVFTSMAVGLSSPYLLLSAFPSLLRYLPKPGAWMVTFKESMGFIMLASAAWLIWVFGAQTDNDAVFSFLLGLVSIALVCWIWGKWGHPIRKTRRRFLTYLWMAIFTGLGLQLCFAGIRSDEGTESIEYHDWEPFSQERLDEYLIKGETVFVDFTAKWCILCQANEFVFLNTEVNEAFANNGITKMRADWTRMNPEITRALKQLGRVGVPLYVLYRPGEPPIILPQTLTPSTIIEALPKAK